MFAVEEGDAEEEEDGDDGGTIAEGGPGELSGSVSTELKGLDDRGHGIEEHDTMERGVGDITERIDDRGGVHPEGDKDREEVREVLVLRRERGDDESESECEGLDHEYKHREEEQIGVRTEVHAPEDKEEVDDDEGSQLEREAEELRRHDGDRRDESREIDLPEEGGIGLEGIGDGGEALGEILP